MWAWRRTGAVRSDAASPTGQEEAVAMPQRGWGRVGRGGIAAALLCVQGCEIPEGIPGRNSPLSSELLSELLPDTVRERALGEGVRYHFLWSARGPWAIHLVSADLTLCSLDLRVVPAIGAADGERLRLPVSAMSPPRAIAGVNGDFFRLDNGEPLGTEISTVTRRLAARPALSWRQGRDPWIGVPVETAEGLGFGPDTLAGEGGGGHTQVMGGYPELLDEGRVASDLGVRDRPAFALNPHPRTGIGFDADADRLWMVVVDGRQEPYSAGMSLLELANLFLWLGAEDALNLDGGGSSTMIVASAVTNSPSDADGARPVGNSLWLVRDPGGCSQR